MDYFKEYGLNDEDVKEIENFISDDDINNYYVNELDVIEILDYLNEIGIKNIKQIYFMRNLITLKCHLKTEKI